MMGLWQDLGRYFTRPLIPFCFGVPLLLPAALLVAVAFLQDDPIVSLRILGIVLLSLSAISIFWGTVLGFYDVRKTRKPEGGGKPLLVKQAAPHDQVNRFVSPTSSRFVSPTSSRSSSRTSVASDSTVGFAVTHEKVRLFPHVSKKRQKNRLKRNVVFPSKKLPSLKEEDQTSARSSEGVKELSPAMQNADNMKKLEEYLKSLGLGGQGHDLAKIHSTSAMVTGLSPKQQEFLRTKSLPEGAFNALMAGTTSQTNGEARPQQRSARTPREMQKPRLVGESHERTGVRMDFGGVTTSFPV